MQSFRPGFYGWRLVAIGVVVLALVGTPSHVTGSAQLSLDFALNRAPDLATLGWLIWAIGLAALSLGLLPLAGMFVDRRGSRLPMLIGIALIGAGLSLSWVAERQLWSFLIITLATLGASIGTYISVVAAVNHWFRDRRATAMAVLLFGADALGWVFSKRPWAWSRWTVAGHGLTILAVALPLALWVRNRPEQHGQRPDGSETGGSEPFPDFSVREALASRQFWLFTLASVSLTTVSMIMVIAPASLVPDRAADADVAQLTAFGNIRKATMLVFLLAGGYVGDHWPIRRVLFFAALLHLLAAIALIAAENPGMFWLSAALLGMGAGAEVPLSLAVMGAYFGRARFATIVGIKTLISDPMSTLMRTGAFWLNDFNDSGILPVDAAAALAGLAMVACLLAGQPRLSPAQRRGLDD